MSPVIILLLILLIAALLYWQLILAEGAYLGRRVVTGLYDLVATRYNAIKRYDPEDDARFLGRPLALALQGESDPLALDVATGTSRLPLALCQQPAFHGRIIAVDNARRMLREATRYLAGQRERVTWVWQHAVPLPFDDDTFEAVTCLEALEFMPDTRAALAECVRVLKPGGLLLVSNRIASGAKWLPGKTFPRARFESLLLALGQAEVTTQVWQFDYDLVWSIKPDQATCQVSKDLTGLSPLRCPLDRGPLERLAAAYQCRTCLRRYPIGRDGVIELLR